jgi:hypothetical protein
LREPVQAWREVLEREQSAALAKFRAISGDIESRLPARDAQQPAQQTMRRATLPVALSDARIAEQPVTACPPRSAGEAAHSWTAPSHQEMDGYPLTNDVTRARAATCAAQDGEVDALALSQLMSKIRDVWPWRKLHFQLDADGVQIWLRDSTLKPEDASLKDAIAQLRNALSERGYRLAAFTLNGIRLI